MKKTFYFSLLLMVSFFCSCKERYTETVTYQINEPIFMSATDFRTSVKFNHEKRDIHKPGKICFYQDYLYISEPEIGIHVIDNSDPAHPQHIAFVELLGNSDLAIRNNQLYADSYIDLLWFDISDPSTPQFSGRIESVFPKAIPATVNGFGFDYSMTYASDRSDRVVVGWELKERTEEIVSYSGGWPWGGWIENDMVNSSTSGSASVGANGSMSRFALYNDNLYTVIENYMSIFDLRAEQPVKLAENIYIGWNVETLFSYDDNMFMGTPTGLLIYSVEDPLRPVFQSVITHVFGCDPVVVHNDIAYVTIHSGNNCGQNANELFVIDVSNVREPKSLATYAMKSPKGLCVDQEMLFLCDDGLKIFNITTAEKLYLSNPIHFKGMEGYDLIAQDNILMMITDDGLYQYDYSDFNNIYLLSKMAFAPQ